MTEIVNKSIIKRFVVPTRVDFDESSRAWRHNKRCLDNGWFAYICQYIHSSNGKRCTHIIEKYKPKQLCVLSNCYAWQYENSCQDKSEIFCKQHKHRSEYGTSWI